MKTKVTQMVKLLTAWIVSLFTLQPVDVIWTGRRHHVVRTFRRGVMTAMTLPLLMGAAFTVLESNPGPALAAGTDYVGVIGVVPEAESQQGWTLAKIALVSPSLVTGATATAVTFTFGYSRAGAAIVAIGTYVTTTGNNLAANTEVVVAITTPPALQAGDVLTIVTTHASTGTALPVGWCARAELN